MLTLDSSSPNVIAFQKWCVTHGLSHEICLGTRPGSLDEIKSYLTPFGFYTMFNKRESPLHFDTLGPVGCFLGHRSAWKLCQDRKETTWIFEEGTRTYHTSRFQTLEQDHPNLDLLLGHTVPVVRCTTQHRIGFRWNDRGVESIDKIYSGTKCYRMSPQFATFALKESETFDLHVDGFLCMLAIYHRETFQPEERLVA
jgi:hypothetical protein